ncbi:hypothetical protein M9Y10_000100 [Tritrichomonas musculus]|uniref:BAR domain-containing protein n=1 Tax=Tritrichomonas musculus TaxID=1915356 RepID=A0ABR2L4F5_9EUKA
MLNNVFSKIRGPVVVKTIDPLYKEAKETLKIITIDADKMINYIEQIENTLKKLSQLSMQFGDDINQFYSDAPEEKQEKAKTNFNFIKNFFALTNGFFIPRTEFNVISLITQYRDETNQLNELKKNVKLLRTEYDKSRAMVQYLSIDPDVDKNKMNQALDKMEIDNQNYSQINIQFVNSVNKLKEKRKATFEITFKNFLCLSSQYMMQIFTEIQKYRITFPPETFDRNYILKDKSTNNKKK